MLAALTANTATDRVGGWIVAIAIAYALGAALPMLAIARGSHRLTGGFRRQAGAVRVGGGILMAVAAVVIYKGWAEDLQTRVPGYAQWAQDLIEGNSHTEGELARLRGDAARPVFVTRGRAARRRPARRTTGRRRTRAASRPGSTAPPSA